MALACLISYLVITYVLSPFVDKADALLGGMWATVATVFVFRDGIAVGIACKWTGSFLYYPWVGNRCDDSAPGP